MAGEGRSILFWVQFGKCTVRRIGSKPWEISNRSEGGQARFRPLPRGDSTFPRNASRQDRAIQLRAPGSAVAVIALGQVGAGHRIGSGR